MVEMMQQPCSSEVEVGDKSGQKHSEAIDMVGSTLTHALNSAMHHDSHKQGVKCEHSGCSSTSVRNNPRRLKNALCSRECTRRNEADRAAHPPATTCVPESRRGAAAVLLDATWSDVVVS